MITWPIFLALILAFFAVRYTIKMEEEEEFKKENSSSEDKIDNGIENNKQTSE